VAWEQISLAALESKSKAADKECPPPHFLRYARLYGSQTDRPRGSE